MLRFISNSDQATLVNLLLAPLSWSAIVFVLAFLGYIAFLFLGPIKLDLPSDKFYLSSGLHIGLSYGALASIPAFIVSLSINYVLYASNINLAMPMP